MRAVNIKVNTGTRGLTQLNASWNKNWKHYLQEALGLAIFMISACFFGSMLEGKSAAWHMAIQDSFSRTLLMGILMGSTALFIFYSPLTSPSGSHINPAVTISFYRIGKMCHWDTVFYILFQFIGGTLAVYGMQILMGPVLTDPPVNTVATIPAVGLYWTAFGFELIIAFITMSMVLITSSNKNWQKYTRVIAACFVTCWVIIGSKISGFGMNPARSFASALPAHIWNSFWIYIIAPLVGMLGATELFTRTKFSRTESVQK